MFEQIIVAILVSVATAVIGVIGKVVNDWSKREEEKAKLIQGLNAKEEAIEALEMGIAKTQAEFVDGIKAIAKDGKLSKDEILMAKGLATKAAFEIATGPALTYLAGLTTDATYGIIEWLLGSKKEN